MINPRSFQYHAPHGTQPTRYASIRSACETLAKTIDELAPESAEKTLALRKVQEAGMWANASIAINEAQATTEGPDGVR